MIRNTWKRGNLKRSFPLHLKQSKMDYLFSHSWFAMPQLVLQADWQEVWHSPHPPFFALSHRLRVSMVSICFIVMSSVKLRYYIIARRQKLVNNFIIFYRIFV